VELILERRVGVWGSSGYLGSRILRHLRGNGYAADELGRAELPAETGVVVDASFPPTYKELAVRSSYLELVGRRAGWAKDTGATYIYLASTSSIPPVTSVYGTVKGAAESIVLSSGGHLLRAGLVVSTIDPGGRLNQLASIISHLPLVVVPATTEFPVLVSTLEDLLDDVAEIVSGRGGTGHDQLVTGTRESSLAEVVADLVRPTRSIHVLPVPPSRLAAWVARRLHFGLLDSLASIAGNPRSTSSI
jgi:hypothetical protein